MSEIPPDPQYSQQPGYSNYPRFGYGGTPDDPYRRPPGVYFDSIGLAWNLVKANLATWVASILIVGVVRTMLGAPVSFIANILIYGSWTGPRQISIQSYMVSFLVGIIPECIANVLAAGLVYMGLKEARGERPVVGDIFIGFTRFGSLVLAYFITSILTALGVVLLIIPGLFLWGLLAFAPLLILDRNLLTGEAISECFKNLRRHGFAIFALMFVSGVIAWLGCCGCLVGLLFTEPIYMVVLGLTYNNFYPRLGLVTGGMQIGVEPPR